MSARKAAAVELDAVTKSYGASPAVDRVSLRVEPGTLVTLLGPSGCGKTTTLRMIAGLEMPTSGAIRIGEADVSRRPPWERDVGMVFQSYALFPHMSVADNVAYGLRSGRMAAGEAAARAREALATVGLSGLEERLPSELSGGQQQRVAVARAIVLEPAVLLFDEPLSNLDSRLRRTMREEIRALQQRLGMTVVYVTHDQSEALAVSDRIVVMDHARIAQAGTPRELYERPETEFVARFMGDANLLDATLAVEEGQDRLAIGPLRIDVDRRGMAPGPVRCAVRLETLEIAVGGEGLAGTIAASAYVGAALEEHVDTALGRLFVVTPGGALPRPAGTAVRLRLKSPPIVLRG